jgi:S-adenosylmethionine hydrolase
MGRIVTLLTDFGLTDTYVGQMKGAVLSRCPDAVLVDLTHAVPSQDVETGAFLLWSAVGAFPPPVVHLAVVDPGVGSLRELLALETARGHVFVGPDNGLLIAAAEAQGGIARVVVLPRPDKGATHVSSTFHGRDILGPVAGELARGVPLSKVGEPFDRWTRLTFPSPVVERDHLEGQVLHVDQYGNLVTNLSAKQLPPVFEVELEGVRVGSGPQSHYAAVAEGQPVLLFGSAGLLEVAVRNGSAAQTLRAQKGARLKVTSPSHTRARSPAPPSHPPGRRRRRGPGST